MDVNNPKTLFYEPEKDDNYISDQDNECSAVQEYKLVHDADDLKYWRAMWYPSCRVCPRQRYCYPSHQMQFSKPKVMI